MNAERLYAALDKLARRGVTLELQRPAAGFVLAPGFRARGELGAWLLLVAIGHHTGHAPAGCSVCGEVQMLSIVNTSGTRRGRPSVGWPRCRFCGQGRAVIREEDFEGVTKRRPPGIPTVKRWLERQP